MRLSVIVVKRHLQSNGSAFRYIDLNQKASLEKRLQSLLWGYPKLIEEFYQKCVLASPPTKPPADQVILRGCRRVSKCHSTEGASAEVWRGRHNEMVVAMKVLRFSGAIENGKKMFEVRFSRRKIFDHTVC